MPKKTTTAKPVKSTKTLLRIGLPLILVVALLWGCAMTQITTSSAQRMVERLPGQIQYFAEKTHTFLQCVACFDGSEQMLVHIKGSDRLPGFYTSFPECVQPFLLDLTEIESLPAELRYGYQVGAALFNNEGETLLATGNLVTAAEKIRHIPWYFEATQVPYLKELLTVDEPVSLLGETYSRIGRFLEDSEKLWYSAYHRDEFDHTDQLTSTKWSYAIYRENYYSYESETNFYYSAVITCQPLNYCMLRLIPFYCVTALAAALVTGVCLWIIKLKLLDPLHEQAEAMEKLLPDISQKEWDTIRRSGLRWAEPMTARSHVIRLQKLKAEMTRMETALEYARDAEENRKQLISNITHELKTPLAVIHSYAEGLQSGIAAEKKEHYVEVILNEADRMDAMVLQMLELSRLEAGRVKLRLEDFSFSDLIRYVTEKFQPMLDAKNLTVHMNLVEPLTIHASESRLEQVLTNYMSNAVRYTPCDGQIMIHAAADQKTVLFNITNTAPHLSQEGLEKVYDSFYREETSRSTKSTGLGLAIVKGIISLHSGDCFVTNTELDGESAVHFGFRIPR